MFREIREYSLNEEKSFLEGIRNARKVGVIATSILTKSVNKTLECSTEIFLIVQYKKNL